MILELRCFSVRNQFQFFYNLLLRNKKCTTIQCYVMRFLFGFVKYVFLFVLWDFM